MILLEFKGIYLHQSSSQISQDVDQAGGKSSRESSLGMARGKRLRNSGKSSHVESICKSLGRCSKLQNPVLTGNVISGP